MLAWWTTNTLHYSLHTHHASDEWLAVSNKPAQPLLSKPTSHLKTSATKPMSFPLLVIQFCNAIWMLPYALSFGTCFQQTAPTSVPIGELYIGVIGYDQRVAVVVRSWSVIFSVGSALHLRTWQTVLRRKSQLMVLGKYKLVHRRAFFDSTSSRYLAAQILTRHVPSPSTRVVVVLLCSF